MSAIGIIALMLFIFALLGIVIIAAFAYGELLDEILDEDTKA